MANGNQQNRRVTARPYYGNKRFPPPHGDWLHRVIMVEGLTWDEFDSEVQQQLEQIAADHAHDFCDDCRAMGTHVGGEPALVVADDDARSAFEKVRKLVGARG